MSEPRATTFKLIAAFAAIYFIWGSTYLAIRYAIQTLPGFLMAAARFMLAGMILFAWTWRQGSRPSGPHAWRGAFVTGFLLLLLGNGTVVMAVHWVPSGVTALLLSTTALWVAILEWVLPGGKHPGGQVSAGILLGFLGIVMLIGVGDLRSGTLDILGVGTLALSSISWAAGSIYARNAHVSASPLMTSAMQMFFGGLLLFVAAILNGDLLLLTLDTVSVKSIAAFLYLTFFGSIVAFTAYSWLVKAASPSRAITSAYVNPVVAVLLGWGLADEPLTYRMMVALLTILLGVAVVTTAKKPAI
ncbi:MAG: EamA family transporter [Acidobacteria bacterium]|nr:EamA family transporter [Acidobacteriota bacterium]